MGGAFVDERAHVDVGVFTGPNSIIYERVNAFYNPDSIGFAPETIIVGRTLLRGDTRILWRSYISNADISGSIELSDVRVCGEPRIIITGKGKIIGGQNKSEGNAHIAPGIMLSNVSLIGEISITGTGVIGHLTKAALNRLMLEHSTQPRYS